MTNTQYINENTFAIGGRKYDIFGGVAYARVTRRKIGSMQKKTYRSPVRFGCKTYTLVALASLTFGLRSIGAISTQEA